VRIWFLVPLLIAFVVVGAAPVAAAQPTPIVGTESFEADLTAGVLDCGGGVFFPHEFEGKGRFTHLGKVTSAIFADSCSVSGSTLEATGHATHTAANGDSVDVAFSGSANLATGAIVFDIIEITGGTGRFEGASGTLEGVGSISGTTGEFTVWGMLIRS